MKGLLQKMAVAGVGTALLSGAAFAAVGNDHTGFESKNNASIKQENKLEVENENEAKIGNMIKGMAKSGYNKSNWNTGDGMVTSGDAKATAKIATTANNSATTVAGCCGASVPTVNNSTTGAGSENNAWVKMEHKVEIENENKADVQNSICVTADSGGNKANANTGDGAVKAGAAVLDLGVTNTLNTNSTTVK